MDSGLVVRLDVLFNRLWGRIFFFRNPVSPFYAHASQSNYRNRDRDSDPNQHADANSNFDPHRHTNFRSGWNSNTGAAGEWADY